MKTYLPKIDKLNRTIDEQPRKWHIIDADGAVLGKVATKAANLLRGKNKPTFTPHLDTGDFVVVINAEKVVLTGKKETEKVMTTYSGYRGGLKKFSPADVRAKASGTARRESREGDDPPQPAGAANFQETQCVRWAGSSA